MARYGIPTDTNPVGQFASGLTRGIQSAQEIAIRQEQMRAVQEEGRSRRQAEEIQKGLAGIDTAAIPTPLPAGQQGPPEAAPWEKLDVRRAQARLITNPERRKQVEESINELSLIGATQQLTQAKALFQKDPQGAVTKINEGFKFVDSFAPDMFSLKTDPKTGVPTITDWEGNPVDGAYMDSIAIAARMGRSDPTAAYKYLSEIITARAEAQREERKVKVEEKKADIAEDESYWRSQYAASQTHIDMLKTMLYGAASGADSGMTFPQTVELARKGMETLGTDPALAAIASFLPTQAEGAATSILTLNPRLPPATAALGATILAGTTFMDTLDDDQREQLDEFFGETGMPYQMEKIAASDQQDAMGNPAAYQVRIVKQGDKGLQPVTVPFIVEGAQMLAYEAKRAPAPTETPEERAAKSKAEEPKAAPPSWGGKPIPKGATPGVSFGEAVRRAIEPTVPPEQRYGGRTPPRAALPPR